MNLKAKNKILLGADIGGNIAQSLEKFLPQIEQVFLDKKITTKILQAVLGENAPIIGACSFAWD